MNKKRVLPRLNLYLVSLFDGSIVQMGSHAEMPKDFPTSILVPAAEKLINVTDTTDEEKESFALIYQLDDSMEDNIQKYKDYLSESDYEVNTVELGDRMVSLQARKDEIFLMYQFAGEDGEYSLTLIYSVEKE